MPSPPSTLLITTVGDFDHNNLQLLYIDGPLSSLHIRLISTAIQTNHIPPAGIQRTATLYVPGMEGASQDNIQGRTYFEMWK
jgi:hypothetical protein